MCDFQALRGRYNPVVPAALLSSDFEFVQSEPTTSQGHPKQVKAEFPHTFGQRLVKITPAESGHVQKPVTVGVIFSGGQAAGGHNVLCGLHDKLKALHADSRLLGFRNGPDGLIKNTFIEIDATLVSQYKNVGGFDMLVSSRTKIEREEQFLAVEQTVAANHLDAIVIIGGDDSNTNAALLAERFKSKKMECCVIGCPKTIDRDLMSPVGIETSFGFDSATKVYSEMIANISRDCLSARKYWHFIRVMGRSASHIALECALQTHPNVTLIGEEVAKKAMSLDSIVSHVADVVESRFKAGKSFGVLVVPEGLIEFIPGISELIQKISDVTAGRTTPATPEEVQTLLAGEKEMAHMFGILPRSIQEQLLLDRDPHGNVQISMIETEKLLMQMVKTELLKRGEVGKRFAPLSHFFGYEGRCVAPSNFDATYCYALGMSAAILISARLSGYMACVTGTAKPSSEWSPCGIPLTSLMTMERRKGKSVPVIEKELVNLDGRPFKYLCERREEWAAGECYRNPGPIQYFVDPADPEAVAIANRVAMCLALEHE